MGCFSTKDYMIVLDEIWNKYSKDGSMNLAELKRRFRRKFNAPLHSKFHDAIFREWARTNNVKFKSIILSGRYRNFAMKR
jgi:hypothetical protein